MYKINMEKAYRVIVVVSAMTSVRYMSYYTTFVAII
jgi:hypothetical protein